MYEKLSGSNSDRYEFVLPDYSLSKTIDIADYPGFLEFYSSGSHNIFDTNKSETRLINDLSYSSDTSILNNGIKNDYEIELQEAKKQVMKIALFRLNEIF